MITISATYAKKLGLPNYSSHSFLVTVQAEIPSLRKIESEAARLFRLLQENVDKQMQEVGFLPDATKYGLIPSPPVNGQGHTNGASNGKVPTAARVQSKRASAPTATPQASEKQSAFIARMAKRLKLSSSDLDNLAIEACQQPVAELDRKQASRLIDVLFELDGQPRRARQPAATVDAK